MLTVPYTSKGGRGVWTKPGIPIEAGTVVWKVTEPLDRVMLLEDLKQEDELTFTHLLWYGIRSAETGRWIIPCDGAKFFRRSDRPNVVPEGDTLVACQHIGMNREILPPWSWDEMLSFKRGSKAPTLKTYLAYLKTR